jgi:hypothetical protein
MTHPDTESQAREVAGRLSEAQRRIVESTPVAGVISGLWWVDQSSVVLDSLHEIGLCNAQIEPPISYGRGFMHVARINALGMHIRKILTEGRADGE